MKKQPILLKLKQQIVSIKVRVSVRIRARVRAG